MNLIETLHGFNVYSICFRLFLAVIMGGMIGLYREDMNRPAGLRTHVLVCLGTVIAMITSEYINLQYGKIVDPSRIGAQVISGIGFLGAGTIILSGKQVKGLTTAAGLWATCCMGLAIGIGFYSGAIIGGAFIFVTVVFLRKLSVMMRKRSLIMHLFVSIDNSNNIVPIIAYFKSNNINMMDIEWSDKSDCIVSLFVTVKLPMHNEHEMIIGELQKLPYVILASELE